METRIDFNPISLSTPMTLKNQYLKRLTIGAYSRMDFPLNLAVKKWKTETEHAMQISYYFIDKFLKVKHQL